jgi:dimethylglycine dehydrogenase
MTGGVNIASAPDRWDWLQSAWRIFQLIGIESARLVTPEEIGDLSPITDLTGLKGGLCDQNEGHLDPPMPQPTALPQRRGNRARR